MFHHGRQVLRRVWRVSGPCRAVRWAEPLKASCSDAARPRSELSPPALAEMGFSESQAEALCEHAKKNRRKGEAQILSGLFALGFNPTSILKILEKCPELYSLQDSQLQTRVANLRKLGLLEGALQRVISRYPQVLALPGKRVSAVSRFLREKCGFSAQQVTDILRDSPQVLQEDAGRLEFMFQYAFFRMGCRQAEMVKAKLFQISLEELQSRHGFLERRGLFQTPDKKGQTLVPNPPLRLVLSASEDAFLSGVASATSEELHVFRRLLARELEEERQRELGSDSEEEEEEQEEDEED